MDSYNSLIMLLSHDPIFTVISGDGREIHTINFRGIFLILPPQFLEKT